MRTLFQSLLVGSAIVVAGTAVSAQALPENLYSNGAAAFTVGNAPLFTNGAAATTVSPTNRYFDEGAADLTVGDAPWASRGASVTTVRSPWYTNGADMTSVDHSAYFRYGAALTTVGNEPYFNNGAAALSSLPMTSVPVQVTIPTGPSTTAVPPWFWEPYARSVVSTVRRQQGMQP